MFRMFFSDAIATTALRLASHASLTLQYPTKRHAFAPEPHMPCVALMSAMIVAVKLHHDVAADEDASRDEWLSQAESKRDDMLRGCPAMFVRLAMIVEVHCGRMIITAAISSPHSDLDVHDGRDLSAYLEMCSTAFFPNYRSREGRFYICCVVISLLITTNLPSCLHRDIRVRRILPQCSKSTSNALYQCH